MLAAAVVLSGSVVAAAAAVVAVVLQEPAVRAPRVLVPVPHAAELPVLPHWPPGAEVLVVARAPPQPLLHLSHLPSPQAVVASEETLHPQGRPSFSAAMARSSPPTAQRTYERAPSTRSPPKGRTCPSACLNWMPVRG